MAKAEPGTPAFKRRGCKCIYFSRTGGSWIHSRCPHHGFKTTQRSDRS